MAEGKATLRKIEEGTSITWKVFIAFLRIHRVTVDGCTCANYCTFAMCEAVLLWLLVQKLTFKVPSQYSLEIVAQCPFKLGCIECKVPERAEPSRKVRTRQSQKLASPPPPQKRAFATSRRKVVAGSDTDSDTNVSSLSLLWLLHPWRCIGGSGIALISFGHLMCVADVTRPCTCGACIVRGVAFAYTLWSVQFVEGPTVTRTSGSFKSGVRR